MLKKIVSQLLSLRCTALIALVWLIGQVVYISTYHYDMLVSDPGFYVDYAMECVKNGTFYPDASTYYNEYVFNPGWINTIVLWLYIFGNVYYLPYLNVAFNFLILILLFKTALKISLSKKIACLVLYIFMLIPSNFTISLHLYSELQFELFALISFYLVLVNNNRSLILGGIFIALAMWTRPVALAWMVAALFLLIIKHEWKKAMVYLGGYVVTCLMIASFTHIYFPDYVYKANTGGVNLAMGANDYADGSFCPKALQPGGIAYIEGEKVRDSRAYIGYGDSVHATIRRRVYTYRQCDSVRTHRALGWIRTNTTRWVSMLPSKTVSLYTAAPIFVYSCRHDMDNDKGLHIIWVVATKLSQRPFYLVMICFCLGLALVFWRKKEWVYVVLPVLGCTAMTIVTVSNSRYNFVLLPYIYLGTAIFISYAYHKIRNLYSCIHIK